MNENRVFSAIIVALLITILLLAMDMQYSGIRKETYQVSVVVSDSGSNAWVPFKAGLEQAAEDNSVELNFVTTDIITSAEEERRIIEQEISDGADGIITEFCQSADTEQIVSDISKRVPVVFVGTDVSMEADVEGNSANIAADNYAIGRAVGNEIVIDYGKSLNRMYIGVLSGNQNQHAMQERLQGLKDALRSTQPTFAWETYGSGNIGSRLSISNTLTPANIMVGLNNDELEAAVDYVTARDLQNVRLYGVGSSEKNVYYLDIGRIDSLIVPHDFNMGYQSLSDLSEKLKFRRMTLADVETGYSIIHRENMFKEENQQLLFPLVQ